VALSVPGEGYSRMRRAH